MANQKKDFKKRFNQVWNPIKGENEVIIMLSNNQIPPKYLYEIYRQACLSSIKNLIALMKELSKIPNLLTNEINAKSNSILSCLKLLHEGNRQAIGLRQAIRNQLTEIVVILKNKDDLFSKVSSQFEYA